MSKPLCRRFAAYSHPVAFRVALGVALRSSLAAFFVVLLPLRASALPEARIWEGISPIIGVCNPVGSSTGVWFSGAWGCDGGGDYSAPNNGLGIEYSVIIDAAIGGFSDVTLNADAEIDRLELGFDPDILRLENNRRLILNQRNDGISGEIENRGLILFESTGASTDLLLQGGDITLFGGGTITFSDEPDNRIYGAAATDRLINVDNLIQGAGQLGVNLLGLDNQGVIDANETNKLTIDTNVLGASNSGTMRATAGGTLLLSTGTVDNSSGLIEAQAGSLVELSTVTISNGEVSSVGNGLIRVTASSTLDGSSGLTNSGRLEVINNKVTTLIGTITNTGTLALESTGAKTDFKISSGDVTLQGGGEITFSASASNRIYAAVATDRLINQDNPISGPGQIGVNQMAFTNRSDVNSNSPGLTLTIDPSASGVINSGTLRATSGGVLNISGGDYQNFEGATVGLIRADNSEVKVSSAVVTGGTVDILGAGTIRLQSGTINAPLASTATGLIEAASGTSTLGGPLTNPAGGRVVLINNADLKLDGAETYQNSGSIELNSSGASTDLILFGGDVELTGGGTLELSDNSANRIYGGVSTDRLVNVNNTISGAGQLGLNLMGLDNQSVIEANGTVPLVINPSITGVINTGSMRAASGATLLLNDGIFTNTGGVIEALDASTVELDNVSVIGGELTTSGSGLIAGVDPVTLDAVTNNGAYEVRNNETTTLISSLVNTGSVLLHSTGASTDLIVSGGDVTLSGGGTLTFSDETANRIYGEGLNSLINVDHTISGAGQIGVNLMGLDNQSVIEANGTALMTLDPSATGVLNTGTLRAVSGAKMTLLSGTFTNNGGLIEAQNASTVELNNAIVIGGELTTSGTGVMLGNNTNTLDTLIQSGTYSVLNNEQTRLLGTITNTGTLSLDSTASNTDLIMDGAIVTLDGGGTLSLSSSTKNRIYGTSNTLINEDNLIEGAGQIGVNLMSLVNRSVIEANDPAASLTIDPDAGGMLNPGTLRASGGGKLVLSAGVVDNFEGPTNGLVEILDSLFEVNSASLNGGIVDLVDAADAALSTGTIDAGTLNIGGSATLRAVGGTSTLGGTVNNALGGLIRLQNNADLELLASGTFVNAGTIEVASTGATTDIVIIGGDVSLSGGGQLLLGASAANRIRGLAATDRLNNIDNTISGGGLLGNGTAGLINAGIVEANLGSPMQIDPNAAGVTNTGTLRATAGATLEVFNGDYFNTGGLIEAQDGSTVSFSGATIFGGELTATGSGQLVGAGTVTLDGSSGIALSGPYSIVNSQITNLLGTLTNTSEVSIDSTTANTHLILTGNATLTGGGTITLANSAKSFLYGSPITNVLTNTDNLIRGGGNLGNNSLGIVNQVAGVIDATQTQALNLNTSAAGMVNEGTLRASAGGTLIVHNNVTGTGALTAAGGEIRLNSGVVASCDIASATQGGSFRLDNADLECVDMSLDDPASLDIDGGVRLAENFVFQGTDETDWVWDPTSTLEMQGGVGAGATAYGDWGKVEVGGLDLGTDSVLHIGAAAGFVDNFHIEELVIGAGAQVVLIDAFDNGNRVGASEALYVDTLTFADPTGVLNLGGLHLYYNTLLGAPAQIISDPPSDSDGDGLDDAEEDVYGTDPDLIDTDGDGYTDAEEIAAGTDPLSDTSFPDLVLVPATNTLGLVTLISALGFSAERVLRRRARQ